MQVAALDDPAAALAVPAAHAEQAVAPELLPYVPPAQAVHIDWPGVAEYLPASHVAQADEVVAATMEPNVPAAHAEQVLLPFPL